MNTVASFITILMGLGHFIVPFALPWDQYVGDLYAPISWALFAMNFFISFLMTWGGILTLVSYKHKHLRKWTVGGMVAFWFCGGVYELLIPFPIAEARWVLPIISFSVFVLYSLALYQVGREQVDIISS